MTQEEILLRVGLDGSNFDANLSRAEGHLQSFSEKGHDSFVHVERPARAFHHLLGEIGRTVPFVAEGLETLVNPTTGVIALIGAGFAAAVEKMKEFNKSMDEIGEHNAKAVEVNTKIIEEQKRATDKLQPPLIEAVTETVLGEKDPLKRITQASHLRDELVRQRDETSAKLKHLTQQEANIPGQIKAEEELVKSLGGFGLDIFEKDIYTGFGGQADPAVAENRKRQVEASKARTERLKAQLGPEGTISQQREKLNREQEERVRSIRRLDLSDQELELMMFFGAVTGPERKKGIGFSTSNINPFGIGARASNQAPNLVNEVLMQTLVEMFKTGEAKVQVPNGK